MPLRSTILIYFLLVALPCATAQRPRNGRRNIRELVRNDRHSLLTLASMPEIRKEVDLRKEQNELIDALLVDVRAQFRRSFEGVNPFRDGIAGARKKVNAIAKRFDGLLEVVLEPAQHKRLKQLQLQREGLQALDRPDFQKQLEVQEAQLKEIQELLTEGRKRIEDAGGDRKAAEQHRAQLERDVMKLLSDQQKDKWIAMKGKTYQFPPSRERSADGESSDPDEDGDP